MNQYLRHHNRRPTFYEPFVTKPVVTQIIKVPDDRYEQDISTDTPYVHVGQMV